MTTPHQSPSVTASPQGEAKGNPPDKIRNFARSVNLSNFEFDKFNCATTNFASLFTRGLLVSHQTPASRSASLVKGRGTAPQAWWRDSGRRKTFFFLHSENRKRVCVSYFRINVGKQAVAYSAVMYLSTMACRLPSAISSTRAASILAVSSLP